MKVLFENLTKKFKDVIAVNNLNLTAEDGEFLVLLGPSGCGKTTTLRLVAGLEVPTSGNIYLGDQVVNNVPAKDRNIAMVFQSYALYPHMNVYNNMALALKVRKVPRKEIDERVHKAAEILRIGDLLERKPSQLSGGQRQRVALGRAIVRDPRVFLMDEPLSNLDAKLRVHMRAELKKLHQTLKTTFIYVTHDQLEAMTLGSRIALMSEGVLQQVGTPEDLYYHPAKRFVAGFLGTPAMNFAEASVLTRDGDVLLDLGPISFPLPKDLGRLVLEKNVSTLTLGVRPEDILVDVDDGFEGSVEVVEPLGFETILHLDVDGLVFVARTTRLRSVDVGNKIRFTFDPSGIHLLHGEDALC